MNILEISLNRDRRNFVPGESITGEVRWQLDKPAKRVELKLFWYTQGKGIQDVGIADSMRFDNPPQRHFDNFSFKAPVGPYSFTGKLVLILWGIELVAEPSGAVERADIVIGPRGNAVTHTEVI